MNCDSNLYAMINIKSSLINASWIEQWFIFAKIVRKHLRNWIWISAYGAQHIAQQPSLCPNTHSRYFQPRSSEMCSISTISHSTSLSWIFFHLECLPNHVWIRSCPTFHGRIIRWSKVFILHSLFKYTATAKTRWNGLQFWQLSCEGMHHRAM